MTNDNQLHKVSRRTFFNLAAATGSLLAASSFRCQNQKQSMNATDTVHDHLWIWTHAAGVHTRWGLQKASRMTPVEGAVYLDVPNLLFIRFEGKPSLAEYRQYAISFRPMKNVVWSLVGSSGLTAAEDRTLALELAGQFPNISGFVLDDFFREDGSGALTPEQLKTLREQLVIGGRKHDLYVVVYQQLLNVSIESHLAHCDKITYWTWDAKDLVNLEHNMELLKKKAPNHDILLGLYMWDYGGAKPMPVDLMARQLDLGLSWLHEGRIEGMIFLASNICDMELDAVEYTRKWIAEKKNEVIRKGRYV
jgi:hypothetical protein